MRNLFLFIVLFIQSYHVIAQIDTLKFIDGTIMVIDGNKIIHPELNKGVFTIVEKSAEFPGGMTAMYKWLEENIRPDSTLNKDVVVKAVFTVNPKGLLVGIIAQGDTTSGKGKEVISLIERMPRWKPAAQHGKTVKMRMALPITFSKIEKSKK